MRNRVFFAIGILLVASLLAGCQAAQPTAAPAPAAASGSEAGTAALVVKGKVGQELSLSLDDFKALGTVQKTLEHPKNGNQDYEGVLLKTLLDKAAAASDASELVLTADDGFSATVSMADVTQCADCMVALGEDNLVMAMPGQASKAWVKGVVSIEVK